MLLEDLVTEEAILERVDDYSIYSFYIGRELEVGRAYNSPLRIDDSVPSFALFKYKNVIFFKDHGLSVTGNVFSFVKLLFEYTKMDDVLDRINSDFDLGLHSESTYVAPTTKAPRINNYKVKAKVKDIRVVSRVINSTNYKDFWNQYGISLTILLKYHVTEVTAVHYFYDGGATSVYYPRGLSIAYRIYDKYKLYMPEAERKDRFRNNYPLSYVEGYLQLEYKHKFCIITKSTKEIMFFREHFGWDAVAGKSESTIIKRFMMLKLLDKFETLYIWLDNDVAGQKAQKAYLEEYPFLVPIYYQVKDKDPTDRYKNSTDKQKVLNEIKTLINEHI